MSRWIWNNVNKVSLKKFCSCLLAIKFEGIIFLCCSYTQEKSFLINQISSCSVNSKIQITSAGAFAFTPMHFYELSNGTEHLWSLGNLKNYTKLSLKAEWSFHFKATSVTKEVKNYFFFLFFWGGVVVFFCLFLLLNRYCRSFTDPWVLSSVWKCVGYNTEC